MAKTKDTDEFEGCSEELVRILKHGTQKELLEYQGGRVLKVRGRLLVPSFRKKAIVSREIEIDEKKYEQAKDKDLFLKQSFIHAIVDELVIECVEV